MITLELIAITVGMILFALGVIGVITVFVLYSCLRVAGKESRKEEERWRDNGGNNGNIWSV